uniref:Uncharacterized protein n=1 Tax=Anguilla anguilla TaxID=7936 RepID=A0A0E9QT14_ANGAN
MQLLLLLLLLLHYTQGHITVMKTGH